MLEKPVMFAPSVVKPPWLDSLFVSATAFASPYGKLAPAKTFPGNNEHRTYGLSFTEMPHLQLECRSTDRNIAMGR
jgi:hypothetical protein